MVQSVLTRVKRNVTYSQGRRHCRTTPMKFRSLGSSKVHIPGRQRTLFPLSRPSKADHQFLSRRALLALVEGFLDLFQSLANNQRGGLALVLVLRQRSGEIVVKDLAADFVVLDG